MTLSGQARPTRQPDEVILMEVLAPGQDQPPYAYVQIANRRGRYADRQSRWSDDFDGDTNLPAGLTAVANLTGTFALNNPAPTSVDRSVGLLTLSTGINVAGGEIVQRNVAGVQMGFCELAFEARVAVSALSTVGDEYSVAVGWWDAGFVRDTGGVNVDGVYFRYDRLADGNVWTAVCSNQSNRQIGVSAVAPVLLSAAMQTLSIWVDQTGGVATFAIDGAIVAIIPAQVPTGAGRQTGICCKILKSAGINSRSLHVDYMLQEVNLGSTDR